MCKTKMSLYIEKVKLIYDVKNDKEEEFIMNYIAITDIM